ncbi:hypothetical protein [Streptomyces sp. NPDC059708]|uniref:hypothetical protein n=1 Tax=Streptomyces sp. NPDC059708 TaxID=3346916 RepID=UPI003683E9E4
MTNVIVSSAGTSGPRGNSILAGAGAPAAGTGIDGDWYINNASPSALVIYGPKTNGAWGSGQPISGGGAAGALLAANNLSDLASPTAARTNLGLGTSAVAGIGTGADTVAAGNDSRFTDSRTPTAHAASHATGSSDPVSPASIGAYTNSAGTTLEGRVTTVENTALTKNDNLASLASAATSRTNLGLGNSATRSVGTTAGTVAAGDDARLSDSRSPTAHAASHAAAGADPVTLTQAQITGLTAALAALAPLAGAAFTGAVSVAGADLTITGSGKGYRLRRGGGGLDLEATGADLVVSNWSGTNYDGTQRSYLRLSADAQNVQIAGKVEHVDSLYGAVKHTLDGAANTVGLYGATPVAQQTVTGSRADGTALANLLTALGNTGVIVNSTSVGQPAPEDLPGEQNLLSWTYDPCQAGHVTAQSNAGVAGRITLTRIPIRQTITWSNVWIGLAGVDAAAVLSNCYLGVYDSSGTLKGTTADISTSLMSGATAKALPLVTPFSAAPGMYYVAMLLNGTWATNSLTFKASGAGISVNAGLTAPNLRYSNLLTGQTSLPSTLTLASQSTSIINTGWGSQWYGVS